MAIPKTAFVWDDTMDPYDVVDYKVDVSTLLQSGESVDSYTIVAPAESVLAGLTIGTASYASTISGNMITMWLSIASAKQLDAIFDTGVNLPVELSISTNSSPPRKRQITLVVKVAQR